MASGVFSVYNKQVESNKIVIETLYTGLPTYQTGVA